MKLERKLSDIGDGVNEVMFAFQIDKLPQAHESDDGFGCVWIDKDGHIAKVLFDCVDLYSDEQVMHYHDYIITLKVKDLYAVCEVAKT